ncbi:MAG: LysM peptidoglycan-binding domain-containing protein [Chloroflexota bacterium]
MKKYTWLTGVLATVVLLVSTGCLRSASDADFQSPEGLPRSTNTPLPTLSPTPGPTDTPVVIQITSIVSVTSTPEPFGEQAADEEETPPAVAQVVSPQPEVEPAEEDDTGIQPAEQQQAPTPTLDPLFVTATAFVLEATQQAEDLTATAEGPQATIPTATPTLDPLLTPSPTPTSTPGAVTSGEDCVHEVRQGENLFRLSLRYGVLVNDIARANNISNVDLIRVGERLTIPDCGTTGVTPPPTSNPTATRTPFGEAGSESGGSPVDGRQYTVQQGDTLFEISLRFGVPVNDIVAANPEITNPDYVQFNTTITIPGA